MVMYLSMAWCWSSPLSRAHLSVMLALVDDISSLIHISNICSSSMRCFFMEPVFSPRRRVPSRKLVLLRSRVCPDPEAPPTLVNWTIRLRRRPTGYTLSRLQATRPLSPCRNCRRRAARCCRVSSRAGKCPPVKLS